MLPVVPQAASDTAGADAEAVEADTVDDAAASVATLAVDGAVVSSGSVSVRLPPTYLFKLSQSGNDTCPT